MSKSIGVFLVFVFVSWILSKEMYLSSLVEGNARCTSNKKNDFRPSEKKTQKITVPVTTSLATTSLRVLPPYLSRQLFISIIIQGLIPILWAVRSQLYVYGTLDLIVWLCGMNYWRDPYYKSWSRTIDVSIILIVTGCHLGHQLVIRNRLTWLYCYILLLAGGCYWKARKTRKQSLQKSVNWHKRMHFCGLISSIVAYINVTNHAFFLSNT